MIPHPHATPPEITGIALIAEQQILLQASLFQTQECTRTLAARLYPCIRKGNTTPEQPMPAAPKADWAPDDARRTRGDM